MIRESLELPLTLKGNEGEIQLFRKISLYYILYFVQFISGLEAIEIFKVLFRCGKVYFWRNFSLGFTMKSVFCINLPVRSVKVFLRSSFWNMNDTFHSIYSNIYCKHLTLHKNTTMSREVVYRHTKTWIIQNSTENYIFMNLCEFFSFRTRKINKIPFLTYI